jgi:hypothetical protein
MPRKRSLALAALFSLFLAVWPAFPGAASLPQTASLVTFGLFTDLHAHDRDSPLDGKWMTHTEERLAAFTDSMNARAVDFVVQLGDFINGWLVLGADPGDPERVPSLLAWADALYGAFDGPRYHVLGNHDLFNLDKAEVRSILGLDSTYYSFDAGPFHFVALDVQYAQDGADLANTFSGVGGFVPDAELAWLRQDLAANRDRPTVVFVHQMLRRGMGTPAGGQPARRPARPGGGRQRDRRLPGTRPRLPPRGRRQHPLRDVRGARRSGLATLLGDHHP